MVENPPTKAGDARDAHSNPGSGRPPREGNGNPLQHSCLENPMDRGAWWAAVRSIAQSRTRLKQLSMPVCIGERNGNPLQCSCLENPGTEEPGGLLSMGSHRVGHD